MIDQILLGINATACGIAAARIIMFDQACSQHKLTYSLLAYVLAVALGAIALRTLFGLYDDDIDIAEVFLNCVLCILVLKKRGNVSRVFNSASYLRGGNDNA